MDSDSTWKRGSRTVLGIAVPRPSFYPSVHRASSRRRNAGIGCLGLTSRAGRDTGRESRPCSSSSHNHDLGAPEPPGAVRSHDDQVRPPPHRGRDDRPGWLPDDDFRPNAPAAGGEEPRGPLEPAPGDRLQSAIETGQLAAARWRTRWTMCSKRDASADRLRQRCRDRQRPGVPGAESDRHQDVLEHRLPSCGTGRFHGLARCPRPAGGGTPSE